MTLAWYDWGIIASFLVASLAIGFALRRPAGRDSNAFFLSGRNVPWWLLGVSMVATTFSTDTPNLVTEIVRTRGAAGNWVWWAFLVTGMFTCFLYARLWRRSGAFTDLEFYELRYSGKAAVAVRAFRAIYLGVFFNVVVIALVTLAANQDRRGDHGVEPIADRACRRGGDGCVQRAGRIPRGRGHRSHPVHRVDGWRDRRRLGSPQAAGSGRTGEPAGQSLGGAPAEFLSGPAQHGAGGSLLVIPLAVQWWSVWYPGSEPGGGGYVAQRMLAAKSERDAVGAVLLFRTAHYATRPWPWIVVALASLVVFPDLDAIREAFPEWTRRSSATISPTRRC